MAWVLLYKEERPYGNIAVRPNYNTKRPLYTWLLITTYTVGAVGGTPGYMGWNINFR